MSFFSEQESSEVNLLREENARLKAAASWLDRWFERTFPDWQTVTPPEGVPLRQFLLERLTRERDELQEHERQTHERLGAILGTDDSLEECAKRLTRERDKARDEGVAARHELRVAQADLDRQIAETEKVRAEVAEYRAEGMVPANAWAHDLGRLKQAEAEVERLEGLILDWHDRACEHGNFFGVATAMMDEARRIQAQRRGV